MDTTTFIRRPFEVEAIKITDANIEEIAKLIGEYGVKADGTKYIQINRNIIPSGIYRVYVGFWLTRTQSGDKVKLRCYSRKRFREQYVERGEATSPMHGFLEQPRVDTKPTEELPQPEQVNVFENPPNIEPVPGGTYVPGKTRSSLETTTITSE